MSNVIDTLSPLTEEGTRYLEGFLQKYARNHYSQSGEDGLLAEIFRRIGTTNRWCFEVGAADGTFCSNTRYLIEQGWRAVLIESDPALYGKLEKLASPSVVTLNRRIGPDDGDTLDDILGAVQGFPEQPDLGVIDIDGQDYHAWNAMLRVRPRVVVIEYKPGGGDIPPLNGEGQAGLDPLVHLAGSKRYDLVARTHCNVIFVDREIKRVEAAPPVADVVTDDKVRLNLGAGKRPIEGFRNLDIKNGQPIYPLRYADASVDEIRASHVLEHCGSAEVMKAVQEWHRVLKPGGTLRIAVPNLEWIARAYLEGKPAPIQGYLMGGQTDADDFHKSAFDREMLVDLLTRIGFIDFRDWKSEIHDCAALDVSLNVAATKPFPFKGRVKCCMSVGRLGFMDHFFMWAEALWKLGIAPTKYSGAFWGQCLERVMEDNVENADWILTVDYDTAFNIEDVKRLLAIAATHPEADAIAPLQLKRGDNQTPLFCCKDENGKIIQHYPVEVLDEPLLKVSYAHFGLTLLRASKLKELPHPWFLGVPNAEGRWAEGRKDDDIYFWEQWEKAGNSLYIATQIPVGHGDYYIVSPDKQGQPVFQTTSDYMKNGVPPEARR